MAVYYTIKALNGDKLPEDIFSMMTSDGARIGSFQPLFQEKLASVGIDVESDESVAYTISWEQDDKSEEDAVTFLASKYSLDIRPLTARLDMALIYEVLVNPLQLGDETGTEVLHAGEAQEDFVRRIKVLIGGLDCKGKSLWVVDPYLFELREGYEENMLLDLLRFSKAVKVEFYAENRGRISHMKGLFDKESFSYRIVEAGSVHDRFWICPESMKGFALGSSLNGLGKRLTLISPLEESDVNEILIALKGLPNNFL